MPKQYLSVKRSRTCCKTFNVTKSVRVVCLRCHSHSKLQGRSGSYGQAVIAICGYGTSPWLWLQLELGVPKKHSAIVPYLVFIICYKLSFLLLTLLKITILSRRGLYALLPCLLIPACKNPIVTKIVSYFFSLIYCLCILYITKVISSMTAALCFAVILYLAG